MIDLRKTRLRVEDGARVVSIPAHEEREDQPGRILGIVEARAPQDLHPSLWEMHPEGDEVLYLIDGSVKLTLERGGEPETIQLERGNAFVVPQGIWHRFERQGPCELLFLTRRTGTEVRPHR